MFVFDVVPVILCALLCQAWLLRPVLHAALGFTAWCQLPTSRCGSQEPAPGLAAFIPLPTGAEAAVLAGPGSVIGACCGLTVGATVMGPHGEPVLRSSCHHGLYWEEPALQELLLESFFIFLCYIIGVLFSLQISLIPAVLSVRMARRRWVLCVRHHVLAR